MGRIASRAVTAAVAVVVGVFAVQGCSADGSAIDEGWGTEPEEGSEATLPPPGPPAPAVDAGKPKDAGRKEVDAGPPPPTPGTPCTTLNEIVKKKCGKCGEHSTVCLADGDSGAGTWSEYGICSNEVVGGCMPGTTEQEACGNCGTRTKTCGNYCTWSVGQCTGQPADSCSPGGIDLSTAGCTTPDTYRSRSCKTDCTWNAFGTSCDPAPTTITVPPSAGGVNWTIASLASAQTMAKMSGTCPNATVSATITPYTYIQVKNDTAKTAVVTIYNSLAPGGSTFKTVLAAYAGAAPPSGDAARKACLKGVASTGTSALTGDSKFASLDGTKVVTIAPNTTISVYVGAYYAYSATTPGNSTGKVKLVVRTESLQ